MVVVLPVGMEVGQMEEAVIEMATMVSVMAMVVMEMATVVVEVIVGMVIQVANRGSSHYTFAIHTFCSKVSGCRCTIPHISWPMGLRVVVVVEKAKEVVEMAAGVEVAMAEEVMVMVVVEMVTGVAEMVTEVAEMVRGGVMAEAEMGTQMGVEGTVALVEFVV